MGTIITSIILCVLTIVVCLAEKKTKKYWGVGFLWLFLIAFSCFTTIGANTVGIFYNPLKGGIQDEVLGEGLRTKSPLDKVYQISTEVPPASMHTYCRL